MTAFPFIGIAFLVCCTMVHHHHAGANDQKPAQGKKTKVGLSVFGVIHLHSVASNMLLQYCCSHAGSKSSGHARRAYLTEQCRTLFIILHLFRSTRYNQPCRRQRLMFLFFIVPGISIFETSSSLALAGYEEHAERRI